MAYTNNIPQPTDIPSNSQPQLLANFQEIATLIAVNHVQFNDANQGKHNKVEMPEQPGAAGTAVNEGAIYTKSSALGSNPGTQLFWQRENGGSEIEFTSSTEASVGWTRLPSNILLKWGNVTPPGSGAQVLTFPVGATIPVFTSIFIVLLSPAGNASIYSTAQTTLDFNYTISAAVDFNYLAIGN